MQGRKTWRRKEQEEVEHENEKEKKMRIKSSLGYKVLKTSFLSFRILWWSLFPLNLKSLIS